MCTSFRMCYCSIWELTCSLIKYRISVFLIRIVIAYLIAALVVSLVLIAQDKFQLLIEPAIALKRLIVITMPASVGAIIADSFDKE